MATGNISSLRIILNILSGRRLYITWFDVSDSSGTTIVPYVSTEVNITATDIIERFNLNIVSLEGFNDIQIAGLSFDHALVSNGGSLPIDVTVHNAGTAPISSVNLIAKLGSSTKMNVTQNVSIAPGATSTLKVELPLEASVAKNTNYTFTASIPGQTDAVSANNSSTITVGVVNIEVSSELIYSGEAISTMVS